MQGDFDKWFDEGAMGLDTVMAKCVFYDGSMAVVANAPLMLIAIQFTDGARMDIGQVP
jgi:hypothetical protein